MLLLLVIITALATLAGAFAAPLLAWGALLSLSLAAIFGLRGKPRYALAALIAVSAGYAHGRGAAERSSRVPPLPVGPVSVEGIVWSVSCDPELRCRVSLAAPRIEGVNAPRRLVTAWFTLLESPPEPGDAVRFSAEVRRARAPKNPSPLSRRPAGYYLKALSAPAPAPGVGSWSARVAVALRERLGTLNRDAAALYRAIVLGDRADLDVELRWAFQDTGTAHLLAISGLHLALVGLGLYRLLLLLLLRWRRLAQGGRPPAAAALMALGLLWVFGALIAPSDATRRALIFMTLHLGAIALARRPCPTRALLFAAGLSVLLDPLAAARPSFQLSFSAASSLILGAPLLRGVRVFIEEPGRIERARPREITIWVAQLLTINLLTFFATAPLAAAWFGQLAPHGLWVNLIAVPLMATIVLPLGFAWVLLALTSPALSAALAFAPNAAARALTGFVSEVAHAIGPATVATWPVWLALLAVGGLLLVLRPRWWRRVGLSVLIACAALSYLLRASPPRGLTLTALDVGHGDALVVGFPDGATMLIDAGGTWQGGAADARLVDRQLVPALTSMGVDRLDVLLITHDDRDHIGGALQLARRVAVEELWLSPCTAASRRGQALADVVLEGGGRVRLVHEHRALGYRGAELEILWPPVEALRADGGCRYDPNGTSLTLKLSYAGRSLLLTGDIEADVEAELIAREGARLRADVLKAPHHGSKTSSTRAFLERVDPRLVIVSGLPGRLPMPPHPSVLGRYARLGVPVWITGRDGAVTVTVDPQGALAVTATAGATSPGGGAYVAERAGPAEALYGSARPMVRARGRGVSREAKEIK